MWPTCMVEFYPSVKKKEIMAFSGKWMGLEIIMSAEKARLGETNITSCSIT